VVLWEFRIKIPEMPNRATGPPEPLIIYARVVPRGRARTPTAAHSISGPRNALYFFENPSNTKETALKPPPILSNSIFSKMLLTRGFILLTIIYIIVYFTLNTVRKIFPSGEDKIFTIKHHILSIIIVYILYQIFKYLVGIIIDKNTPK
jgi:hypothetical protein